MLAIGRSLMSRPELIMLDEPSMGLAPLVIKLIFSAICSLSAAGKTILVVEQNAKAILKIASRGYVMETGSLVLEGTGEELLANRDVQRAYLGKEYSSIADEREGDMTHADPYERMDREDLEQVQVERLQATLNRACQNVAFYREGYERLGLDIGTIKSLRDLAELPFTTKEDLRESYPYGMFAVPLKDVVRIHSTSGTTGKPVVVGYTAADIAAWSSLTARVLRAAGITENDLVQIAFNYNLSSAGLGFHYGAERIGSSVVPSSGEGLGKQVTVMRDYKTTALVATPSYAAHIATYLREKGIHPEELRLRAGLFGAEPWSEGRCATRSRGGSA